VGVNNDLNTTMKGQTLVKSMVKPSPTKRMPIDTSVTKIKKHDVTATMAKVMVNDASMRKTNVKLLTSDESVAKHGVIYEQKVQQAMKT